MSSKKAVPVERISPREEYNLPIFRSRLKEVLQQRGISQRQLALHLERDPRQINLTVIGQHKPDLQMLKGIAEFCNISLDWLFGVGRRPRKDEAVELDATVPLKLNDDPNMMVSLPKAMVQRIFGATNHGDLHLISVDSQDMAPTFQEGDLVFLKKAGFQNKSGIYLLRTGKINAIRRLSFDAVSNKVAISQDSQPDEKHQTTVDKINVIGQIFRISYFV